MAYNVSQTSFLYFGDEGPQSSWLCNFSTNHLDRTVNQAISDYAIRNERNTSPKKFYLWFIHAYACHLYEFLSTDESKHMIYIIMPFLFFLYKTLHVHAFSVLSCRAGRWNLNT